MEDNPALAARLERALFDDHFEVLRLSGDTLPVSVLENQYAAFESAGLVVIYSCARSGSEAKRKLGALAAKCYFDLSAMQFPPEEIDAVRKILALLQSLRAVSRHEDPGKINQMKT